jgi:predicted CopG family antitoxin
MPRHKVISKTGKEYVYARRWILLDEETYQKLKDMKQTHTMSFAKIINQYLP